MKNVGMIWDEIAMANDEDVGFKRNKITMTNQKKMLSTY
jgi:hypothetical protein